jgi:hypothetical protein
MRSLLFVLAVLSLAGCDRRKGPGGEMKKAEDWGGGDQAAKADNPHAGMDMADPHAGVDMADPHAGVDMADPHAGVDMTGPGGLPAPDPNRPIDPSKFIRGTIALDAKTKAPSGGVIFLAVRPADASGNPAGPPLAVDVIESPTLPLKFELTEAQAMIGGTAFSGNVVVTARFDQDQDVDTKQPGDLSGKVGATIPSEGVKLTLDTVQP